MTDRIKELEEQLAKARSEEASKEGFTVVIFDDDMGKLKEIKARAKEINSKEHAEIINKIEPLRNSLDDIEAIQEKLNNGEVATGELLELLFIIDEPIKVILSRFFNLPEEIIATVPNLDLALELVEGDEFSKIKDKTERFTKEIEYATEKHN